MLCYEISTLLERFLFLMVCVILCLIFLSIKNHASWNPERLWLLVERSVRCFLDISVFFAELWIKQWSFDNTSYDNRASYLLLLVAQMQNTSNIAFFEDSRSLDILVRSLYSTYSTWIIKKRIVANLYNTYIIPLLAYFKIFRDDIHMTSMKIVQFSRPPTSLVHLHPKFFHPLDLGRPISNEPPSSLQMTTNQLKENIILGWLSYVIKTFLQVGFRFQHQLIILVWLSFDLFLFGWNLTICFFVALYSWVCSFPKMSRNVYYL